MQFLLSEEADTQLKVFRSIPGACRLSIDGLAIHGPSDRDAKLLSLNHLFADLPQVQFHNVLQLLKPSTSTA